MSITYYECVFVALSLLRAMRLRDIVICVACQAVEYFDTLSHKWHDFRREKKCFEQNDCFAFLSNFCPKHFLF